MATYAYVTGVREVQQLLDQVGKAPAKALTKAVRPAAKLVQKAAKNRAPADSGALKKGIKIKAERRKKGKRVYQIGVFGAAGGGEEFVKISKSGKRSYYPASQEYGWTDEHGNYTPGYQYLRKAADVDGRMVHSMILETLGQELDRLR
ncbi:MAG: HK97 gp10 family phage protein [Desulfosporosinus sp.]